MKNCNSYSEKKQTNTTFHFVPLQNFCAGHRLWDKWIKKLFGAIFSKWRPVSVYKPSKLFICYSTRLSALNREKIFLLQCFTLNRNFAGGILSLHIFKLVLSGAGKFPGQREILAHMKDRKEKRQQIRKFCRIFLVLIFNNFKSLLYRETYKIWDFSLFWAKYWNGNLTILIQGKHPAREKHKSSSNRYGEI